MNAGLKDIRKKPLIVSGITTLLTNGSSSASLTFEDLAYVNLISNGESDVALSIVSNFNLSLESSGESDASLEIYNSPIEPVVEEKFEGVSRITVTLKEESEYTLNESFSSQVNTLTNNKSKLYG